NFFSQTRLIRVESTSDPHIFRPPTEGWATALVVKCGSGISRRRGCVVAPVLGESRQDVHFGGHESARARPCPPRMKAPDVARPHHYKRESDEKVAPASAGFCDLALPA